MSMPYWEQVLRVLAKREAWALREQRALLWGPWLREFGVTDNGQRVFRTWHLRGVFTLLRHAQPWSGATVLHALPTDLGRFAFNAYVRHSGMEWCRAGSLLGDGLTRETWWSIRKPLVQHNVDDPEMLEILTRLRSLAPIEPRNTPETYVRSVDIEGALTAVDAHDVTAEDAGLFEGLTQQSLHAYNAGPHIHAEHHAQRRWTHARGAAGDAEEQRRLDAVVARTGNAARREVEAQNRARALRRRAAERALEQRAALDAKFSIERLKAAALERERRWEEEHAALNTPAPVDE